MAKVNLAGLTREEMVLIETNLRWVKEHLKEVERVVNEGRQPHSKHSVDMVSGIVKSYDGIDKVLEVLNRI